MSDEIHIVVALTHQDWDRYVKKNNLPRDSIYISNDDCMVKILGFRDNKTYHLHRTERGKFRFFFSIKEYLNERGCKVKCKEE